MLEVIEFDKDSGGRSYFNCKCNRCNNITSVRSDHLSSKTYTPKSCTFCIDALQKEIADSKYLKDRPYAKRFNSIKANAISRDLEFDLNKDEVFNIISQPCYYCGQELVDNKIMGIDRIDSNKGYNSENTVPCCHICNLMKNAFTIDVFFNHIDKIYNKHIKKSSTTIETTS